MKLKKLHFGIEVSWESAKSYEEQKDAPPLAAIFSSIQVLCLATSAYTPYKSLKWHNLSCLVGKIADGTALPIGLIEILSF